VSRIGARFGSKATGGWGALNDDKIPLRELSFSVEPQVYARPGEKEKAFKGLQHNDEERRSLGTLLNVDPAFDSLRSDQRFGDLVRRMGLTPGAKADRESERYPRGVSGTTVGPSISTLAEQIGERESSKFPA
jgi:hypothetical protein